MAQRIPVTVRLDTFEGPLDLLLYLIQSHEMDISKVSIEKITDQYLKYVQYLQELNFDVASEFLVIAATLLHWKSKAVLPKTEEEQAQDQDEDGITQEDLIRQLIEHQRFLAAGDELAQLPRLHEDIFVRENKKPPVHRVWREMNVTDLTLAYQENLVRARKRKTVLRKETVSVSEKVAQFAERLEVGKLTEIDKLIMERIPGEIVVTFLASLELSRQKKMKVYQEGTYQTIFLELLEKLESLDLQIASEFDAMQGSLNTLAEGRT